MSVVIPCYNYGDFLPEAVCSVLVQSYRNWELIIVDDGSEDDTAEVAQELIDQHPFLPIRLIEQRNNGVSHARNTGITASCGRYVVPLDADDALHPTMLERVVQLLDDNPGVTIAYTDFYCIDEPVPGQVMRLPEFSKEAIIGGRHTYSCMAYRREAWESVGGYDTELVALEDWDFWLGCIERGFEARRVPEALWGLRIKREGLHLQVLAKDLALRAMITSNHPGLFNEVTLAWAEAVLTSDGGPDPRIPDEVLARSELTDWLCASYPTAQNSIVELQEEVNELRQQLRACRSGASANGSRSRRWWFGQKSSR